MDYRLSSCDSFCSRGLEGSKKSQLKNMLFFETMGRYKKRIPLKDSLSAEFQLFIGA